MKIDDLFKFCGKHKIEICIRYDDFSNGIILRMRKNDMVINKCISWIDILGGIDSVFGIILENMVDKLNRVGMIDGRECIPEAHEKDAGAQRSQPTSSG